MKLFKIVVHENCQILAVVDDADNIISAAAFTSDEDTETAENFAYTLLLNLGFLKKTPVVKSSKTISEFLDIIKGVFGDGVSSYIKDI